MNIEKYLNNLAKFILHRLNAKTDNLKEDLIQVGWEAYLSVANQPEEVVKSKCYTQMRDFAVNELFSNGMTHYLTAKRSLKGRVKLDYKPLEYIANHFVDERELVENRELLKKISVACEPKKRSVGRPKFHHETLKMIINHEDERRSEQDRGMSRAAYHERVKQLRLFLKSEGFSFAA